MNIQDLSGGFVADVEGGAGCPVGYKKSSSSKPGRKCVKCTKRTKSGKCTGKRVYTSAKRSGGKRSTKKRSTRKVTAAKQGCPSGTRRSSATGNCERCVSYTKSGGCARYAKGSLAYAVPRRSPGYKTPYGYATGMSPRKAASPVLRTGYTPMRRPANYYTPARA